jgi:hypothetical protein
MPTDNVLQFLPRANPKADKAFWRGPDREAILRAGAVEIESVKIVDQGRPSDSAFDPPDTDSA